MTAPAHPAPESQPPHQSAMLFDAERRELALDALRIAADWTEKDLDCGDCLDHTCTDTGHQSFMAQVRDWRDLAHHIDTLTPTGQPEPALIDFDPQACRQWLQDGAAEQAGIGEGFNTEDLTIAAGLEELLPLLNGDPGQPAWRTRPPLDQVLIWRTADSHGIDGGAIITADLKLHGERVRLAALHQGHDEFTSAAALNGIAAAAEALAHVASLVNREYTSYRAAMAPVPDRPEQGSYTVIGVWIGDQPVPVGVIEGIHQVSGGDDSEFEEGLWATSVTATDPDSAEHAAIADMLGNHQ